MPAPVYNVPKHNWRQVTLSSTPTLIFRGQAGIVRMLQNWGATDIIVGDSSVSASGGKPANGDGFLIKGNQTVPQVFSDNLTSAAWYAVSADGSSYSSVSVDEIF